MTSPLTLLPAGTRVMLLGLQFHPELNGHTGHVLRRIGPQEIVHTEVGRLVAGPHVYGIGLDGNSCQMVIHRALLIPLGDPGEQPALETGEPARQIA